MSTARDRLRRGNLSFFPVVAGRMEFAVEVRRRVLEQRPAVIAVELPQSIEKRYLQAIERLPQISALMLTSGDRDDATFLVIEPADPFTEALRSAFDVDAKPIFLEPPLLDRPTLSLPLPDTYAIRRIGLEAYWEALLQLPFPDAMAVRAYAQHLTQRLQALDPFAETLVVLSAAITPLVLHLLDHPQEPLELPAVPFTEAQLVNPSPVSLVEICTEYPFLQERYEQYRILMEPDLADRLRTQRALYREAALAYEINTGDAIRPWQRRLLPRFTRNLAMIDGQLLPNLFDLVVGARSIVDDNFAWEVHHLAGQYPAQRETSWPETLDLSAEEVFVNTMRTRIRRRLPRTKATRPGNLKDRKLERRQGEWGEQLGGQGICSYPPEDFVIEDYGRLIKTQASQLLSREQRRTQPFVSSMLDGVDLRETLRNWHQGKIFVQELGKDHTDVGSVVVIFDEDRDDRYYYCTTWLGEHQNESDMAFYATHPFDHLVGPGIGRAEYGGFLMTLPSRRLHDVWGDDDYQFAETKAERLLLAGLDYSLQPTVVYVAAKPPRSIYRTIAARMGRRIQFVPIGGLAPDKLKRIRVVHVLDGYDKRDTAKDYIW